VASANAGARSVRGAGGPAQPWRSTGERLIEPNELASLVAATDQPHECLGHEPPTYLVQVVISREAAEAYRAWGPGSSMPKGTWLVARHSLRKQIAQTGSAPEDQAPIYTMFRGPGGWLFGAATREGWKIPVSEGACQDCHTQARADFVFGPPVKLPPADKGLPTSDAGTSPQISR
jgi:hypothetical protein